MMGNKPSILKHPVAPSAIEHKEVPKYVQPTPRPDPIVDSERPPTQIVILGWYSNGASLQVKFPEGYGFLGEGDFFRDWRIKKLLSKGCILVDMSGHEYLVRLRLNYADPVERQMQNQVPSLPDPMASR